MAGPATGRRRRKAFRWLIASPLILVAALIAALWALDTGPGHRFLVDRLAEISTNTGLRFRIGRIEGSIYGEARLRDVRVYDPKGLVFSSPLIDLDWRPLAWFANRLHINSVTADLATLHKLPELRRTGRRGPILPGFDIYIGRLEIERLRLARAVTGEERAGRLASSADIRDGRAMVRLGLGTDGGDRLRLVLDAEPDRDRFDIDARLSAPAGGLIGKLLGAERPIEAQVAGDGRWTGWAGSALVDVGGERVVDLRLTAQKGLYTLTGDIFAARVTQGKLARLSSPRIIVNGTARLADRRLDTDLSLRSAALAIDADGVIDLATSGFDDMRLTARLLRPAAMFPNMRGVDVQFAVLLDGQFDRARFEYLLTSPRVMFDNTGFDQVRATGQGRFGASPVIVPIKLTARRVTGVGDVAGGILANLSVEGLLRVTSTTVMGDDLRLRSDKLTSRVSLFLDLRTGRYDVSLTGQLNRYFIPGIGIVDVRTDLQVVPGPGGRGVRVLGRGVAAVRRFDNAFLAGLAGGLPRIETALERGPDGVLYLRNLRLTGPKIAITGNGYRRRDGTFHFEGSGRQGDYGPLKLTLDGRIDRPRLDIFLSRPLDALGLSDVRLQLEPTPDGFLYKAAGGSTLGPFTSNGAILLPRGAPARIQVAALNVAEMNATGEFVSAPGGFDGRLAVKGGGVSGDLRFDRVGSVQRIAASLDFREARFPGPPQILIRRGSLDGEILLDPAGMGVDATVTAQGVRRGNVSLARLAANIDMRGGRGTVKTAFAGSRGRAFDLQAVAQIAPDRVSVTGGGTVDRRPIKLTSPAVLTREGGAWRLAPTALEFAGGAAKVAGRFGGGEATELDASLSRMPLTVLDIGWPELGLGGVATGRLAFRWGDDAPAGSADLTIRGLTRSGLVLSSRPVDVGLKAVLRNGSAAARAVIASGGKTIGRAQARLSPVAGLNFESAPLFAQLRYNGAADTLWRLTGIEAFDLSGPVAVGADISGTLANPVIRGSLRTAGARLESPVTGTVLTNVKAAGRFGGSRLVIDNFTGSAGEGSVSGSGAFDFGAAQGVGMNLSLQTRGAVLLNRDDIGATVTGPLTIRSDGSGGMIEGEVTLIRSRFRLGRATAAAEVPRLNVREINRRADLAEEEAPPVPWRLAVKATAPNRLMVTGLGIESEWQADLQIGGAVDAPTILGRADLIRGGYEFAGRRFDLERGTIRFTGSSPPDPVLDILAQANLQGINATIRVTGTGQRPEISFASIPALPEDELLSRLLFGTSITNLSAPEALQLAAAVASLQGGGGTGLNPINTLRDAAGLDRLRILPADPLIGQGTAVAAGEYIGRRVYVEVITDGQGYSATRAEFQITRWLSILSTISTIGRQSVNVRVSRDY